MDKLEVAKQEALKLYCKTLKDVQNDEHNSYELLQAIGGIDNVLKHYLSKQINILNETQVNHVLEILSNINKRNKENDDLNPQTIIYFKPENTFLHSLLSSITSQRIITFIYHKFVMAVLILLQSIYMVLSYTNRYICYIFGFFYLACFALPFFILILLSLNRNGVQKILTTFLFWIKMGYGLIFIVCDAVDKLFVQKERNLNAFVIPYSVIYALVITLFVTFICMLDANRIVQSSRLFCIICTSVTIIYFLSGSIYYEFISYSQGESLIKITPKIHISLTANLASSTRILCLFFMKQCFLLYKGYKNNINNAISIRIVPNIEWSNVSSVSQNEKQISMTINIENKPNQPHNVYVALTDE
eukprot:118699_1